MKVLKSLVSLLLLFSAAAQADTTTVVFTPSYDVEGMPGAMTGNTLAFSGAIAQDLTEYLKQNGNHYVEWGGNNSSVSGKGIGCGIQAGGAPSCSLGIDDQGRARGAGFLVDALHDAYFDAGLGGSGKAAEQRKESEIGMITNDHDRFMVTVAGLAAKALYDNLVIEAKPSGHDMIKLGSGIQCSHRPGKRYEYLCVFGVGKKGEVSAQP